VYHFYHHQLKQYGRAGCITFITTNSSSMDVQGVSHSSPPTQAVWTCRVYHIHHHQLKQYGRAGCTPFFKCRTVGLSVSGIQSVRYRNEKNVDAGTSPEAAGPTPVPEHSGTGVRYRLPVCRCRRHRPRCRCPAILALLSNSHQTR
jgi:hypothetical protein